MAERINRGHNKLQEWGLKGAALVALGAIALTGCGTEKAGASHSPDRPAASASATPGSNESSQSPSETASSSPETTKPMEMGETKLANSKVYNELSESDQTAVEKNSQLSFDDFEKLPVDERAMVALVLSDAHSAEYLEGVKNVEMPGNGVKQNAEGVNVPKTLGDILTEPLAYIPANAPKEDGKVNVAQDLYYWSLASTPEDITSSNNGQPYFQVQFERAIAAAMASTGDAKLLEDAKKIVGGSLYHGSEPVANAPGAAADQDGWGNITDRVNELRTMNETKVNPLKYLGFPDAGTDRHDFAMETDGPFKGHPGTVSLGFIEYDPTTHSMVQGVNSDGAAAATYKLTKFATKDGHHRAVWTQLQEDASDTGVVLEPNTTS